MVVARSKLNWPRARSLFYSINTLTDRPVNLLRRPIAERAKSRDRNDDELYGPPANLCRRRLRRITIQVMHTNFVQS